MKKIFFYFVLVFCVCAIGFSTENSQPPKLDIWIASGTAFGNYFISGNDIEKNYTGSPGFDCSSYALFGGKNMGVFFNTSILFPAINNVDKNYSLSVQFDCINLGFGFGFDMSEKLKLRFGIGPNMNALFLHSMENDVISGDYIKGFGIGGDIGLKINPIRFLCIDVGTTVTYNFLGYREIRNDIDFRNDNYETDKSSWVNRYSLFGIKPYVTVGFNFRNR